jgi:hypothetical protein
MIPPKWSYLGQPLADFSVWTEIVFSVASAWASKPDIAHAITGLRESPQGRSATTAQFGGFPDVA